MAGELYQDLIINWLYQISEQYHQKIYHKIQVKLEQILMIFMVFHFLTFHQQLYQFFLMILTSNLIKNLLIFLNYHFHYFQFLRSFLYINDFGKIFSKVSLSQLFSVHFIIIFVVVIIILVIVLPYLYFLYLSPI